MCRIRKQASQRPADLSREAPWEPVPWDLPEVGLQAEDMSVAPLLGKARSKVGRELAEPQPFKGQLWPSVHVAAGDEVRLA